MRRILLIAMVVIALATFAPAVHAQNSPGGRFQLDTVDMGTCWTVSINPNSPCYSGAGYPGCTKGTDYDTCFKYCECGYEYNKKECDGKQTCLTIAERENAACEANCVADYAP